MPEKECIERDKAINAVFEAFADGRSAYIALEAVPAADVRPVVLCKDCKNDCHCMIQDFMEDYGITPDDQNNFFCGFGEREKK